MSKSPKHIVIDGRIRRASTGRPVDRFLNLLPSLDDQNNYTILIEKNDPISFKAKNIETKVCKYKNFSMNPIHQIGFSLMLYRLRPDLVFFTMTGLAPLFYFGKNITFTHDLTMLRFVRAGRLPGWLHQIRMTGYHLLFWKGNNISDQIITPTEYVKNDLSKLYSATESKINVVYEAGDLPIEAKAKEPSNHEIKSPFIMHVGSPFPHKNINNLVIAFESLKTKNPDLKLVLIGKKEYYFAELENWLHGRDHTDDIFITGFVSDSELKWFFEKAECYVLPSLSEGFGLPGLEAFANKCPLVSSNATCLPEVYGDGAEYFDPNNVKDMSSKIQNVISDKILQKKLISNGQKQLKKYSWEKMSREIMDVINNSIGIK